MHRVWCSRLETLLHSRCHGSEVAVHLGWRATENEGNNGGASHVDVLETCRRMISDLSIEPRHPRSVTYHPECEFSSLRARHGSCLRFRSHAWSFHPFQQFLEDTISGLLTADVANVTYCQ